MGHQKNRSVPSQQRLPARRSAAQALEEPACRVGPDRRVRRFIVRFPAEGALGLLPRWTGMSVAVAPTRGSSVRFAGLRRCWERQRPPRRHHRPSRGRTSRLAHGADRGRSQRIPAARGPAVGRDDSRAVHLRPLPSGALTMDHLSLDEELLRALRSRPDRDLSELADAVRLPRTNFVRRLSHRLREPIEHLIDDGLVEEHAGRYRLSEPGGRTLAERVPNRGRDA